MGETQFNIVDYARRVGLKNVTGMPVIEAIQPVSIIGDQSGLSPKFEPPAAFAGGAGAVMVGERGVIELQSLGAGGCIVTAFVFIPLTSFRMFTGTGLVPGGAQMETFVTSNEAPLSILRFGTAVAPAGNQPVMQQSILYKTAMYVPRGDVLSFFTNGDNQVISGTVWFQDVPASEHGPA